MKMSRSAKTGICLILGGIALFGFAIHWLAPHANVAMELPVSLSPGHVTTGNFSVNPGTLYYIEIELDRKRRVQAHCEPRSVLSTQWVLSSDGKEKRGSSPWEDTGLTIGALYSERTRYSLDVEILPGASCLNASNPRLKVQTHPYPRDLYVYLTWFSILPVSVGLALLVGPYIVRGPSKIERTRIFPEMVLRQVMPVAKHAPLRPISEMPNWGLAWGAVMMCLMFLYILTDGQTSKGLYVNWRKTGAVVWVKSPWPDTLEVYVGPSARFFVNNEKVGRDGLRSKLIEELGRRTEWTVYFEADPEINFSDALYAIDVIQSCGAKVSWITPKMRKEWQVAEPSTTK